MDTLRHLPLKHHEVEKYSHPLGPQNATGPSIAQAPTDSEPATSNPSNVHLLKNALFPTQSPQPISPSHFSGEHTQHNVKYLEHLLDSSLATVAVIQFSGNTLADVLTPRAYDTFKALYALAALDTAALSTVTKSRGGEIPNCFTFPGISDDCPYLSNHLPPFPNSSLVLPPSRSNRIHISISVEYVMLFSLARMAALYFLVAIFNLPRLCDGM